MLKANDLRIGNLVDFINSKGAKIRMEVSVSLLAYMTEADPDYFKHGFGNVYREGSVKPIPLTSQLLDSIPAFGVTSIDSVPCYFNGDDVIIRPSDMAFLLHDESDGQMWFVKRLKYLHQLQNLYFALTGEELEINLPVTA